MLALVAASYYPDITLTIAMSPSDFVMEGFYRDGKDGMTERPGDNESSVSWQGKPLPYLPYAYRHPEYWQKIQEESRAGADLMTLLFKAGREYPKECKAVREDIDNKLKETVKEWYDDI